MSPERPAALVTGGSSGIGAAVAVDLAEHGYDVAVTSRSEERLGAVCAEVRRRGARALAVSLDVRDASAVEAAVEAVQEAFGQISLLVNNAGVTLRRAAVDVTLDEWREVMETNVQGAFFASRAAARLWLRAGLPGVVVNISSTHGRAALPDRSVYCLSKAALDQMTRALALEWAEAGIRVNAVVPATVATPSREVALADPDVRAFFESRIPLKRFATPQEVASAVRYLASGEASFVTGVCLPVDGGLTVT